MEDDRETLQPGVQVTRPPALVPTLTILCHPDVTRIGEEARLTDLQVGRAVPIARGEPSFGGRGLEDRSVSRRPFHLAPQHDDLVVDAKGVTVSIDGVPVTRSHVVPRAALERGVVVELGERVVLLLHLASERVAGEPDLGIVGRHPRIDELRREILRAADLAVPVLIRGETGTGKELVARAVHVAGPRASGPFTGVNIAAIPAATAAAELFGYARGAFTGADTARRGYFDAASGGTLFLDEIGATPAEVQPLLLRALDSFEIQPLGNVGPRKVDVRLITATDADLEHAIAAGTFRSALLHRLEGYQLAVPPLRERREDFGRLLIHFVRAELEALGELDRLAPRDDDAAPWLPAPLVARLARLDWPGNVRQLRNAVRQLCIASRGLATARADATLERLIAAQPVAAVEPLEPQAITEDAVRAALRVCDYRVGDAATALGVSRAWLYNHVRDNPRIRQAKDLGRDEIERARVRCNGDVAMMARDLEVSRRALTIRLRELEPVEE